MSGQDPRGPEVPDPLLIRDANLVYRVHHEAVTFSASGSTSDSVPLSCETHSAFGVTTTAVGDTPILIFASVSPVAGSRR